MAIESTCRDNDVNIIKPEGLTPYQTSSENEWQWFSHQVQSEWQSDELPSKAQHKPKKNTLRNRANPKRWIATPYTIQIWCLKRNRYTFSHMRLPYYSSKGAGGHFYFYSNHPGKATATLITKLQSRKHNSTFQLQIHFQLPKEMPNALQNNTKELLTSKGGHPPLSDAKVLLYLQGCIKIFGSARNASRIPLTILTILSDSYTETLQFSLQNYPYSHPE